MLNLICDHFALPVELEVVQLALQTNRQQDVGRTLSLTETQNEQHAEMIKIKTYITGVLSTITRRDVFDEIVRPSMNTAALLTSRQQTARKMSSGLFMKCIIPLGFSGRRKHNKNYVVLIIHRGE